MTLKFVYLIVFSASHILLFMNDLVVDDPVGLITCGKFWISLSVTPAFPWICAGISGCEQPLDLEQRKKWRMKCWVFCEEQDTSRERNEMKRLFLAHNQFNLEPQMWCKE